MYDLPIVNYVIIMGILIAASFVFAALFLCILNYITYRTKAKRWDYSCRKHRLKKMQRVYHKILIYKGFQNDCRYQQAIRNYMIRGYE